MTRKHRTRQHVIEDLSCNYVERFILQCSYSAERITKDYGIDLTMFTYNQNGEIENGSVGIQLKATDSIQLSKDGATIQVRVETAHLEHWLTEPMPVFLILFDAHHDLAYWLYIQRYFERSANLSLNQRSQTITLHIPAANVVNAGAIEHFAACKRAILEQVQGVIRHA